MEMKKLTIVSFFLLSLLLRNSPRNVVVFDCSTHYSTTFLVLELLVLVLVLGLVLLVLFVLIVLLGI